MEEILGYRFRDTALLERALTTPAYRMDHPDACDNQRLEFLGDAVLGMLAADRLYRSAPKSAEGDLTVRRTHMVSSAALCAAAARLALVPLLKRNAGAKPLPPNSKTIADAVEAIAGAAWLDGGLAAAETIYAALDLDVNAESGEWSENPKGTLQIRAQAMTPPRHPVYETIGVGGVAHDPVFTVRVTVDALGSAEASARKRNEAEAAAARALLEKLK